MMQRVRATGLSTPIQGSYDGFFGGVFLFLFFVLVGEGVTFNVTMNESTAYSMNLFK
jgi:hypothetical protein